MSHGLSFCFGAIVAWLLCLAPVAFAREPLSMPGTLAPASTPVRYITNLSVFLIWIRRGIFLGVGGLLALASFRSRAHKSDPLSGPTQVYRSTEIDLIPTLIPVLVLVLFLATGRGIVRRVARPDRRTGPDYMTEIGGKTVQPVHGVMTLIVNY